MTATSLPTPPNSPSSMDCDQQSQGLQDPVFIPYHNDVLFVGRQAFIEAYHLIDLYTCYADKHNDHWTPYNYNHPDVLERRIYQSPDIEIIGDLDSDERWRVSLSTATALRAAFRQVRINLGEATELPNWNRDRPWDDYEFGPALIAAGFPYIPEPEGWSGPDALTQNFSAYYELVEHVAHLQFYSICIHVLSQIYAAHTFLNYTEQMWAGYVRSSPGLVAAHRYWMRKEGYSVPPDTQDSLSDDGKPHFVETLHIPLRVLTPSFTGFNSEPDTNLPELVGWESVSDSPSSMDSFSPPPPFTTLPDSSGKEVSPEVTSSMHSRIDGSASPFDAQTWAEATYEPPKIATPTEWPEVDPSFFSHLSGTTLPEPDSYADSSLTLHSGELKRFSKLITLNQITTLTSLHLLEELGWVIAELLNTLKIEGDEGMNEEMVKYKDAFTFPEWLHILGAIEELKEE
jgi:hypothetical protein